MLLILCEIDDLVALRFAAYARAAGVHTRVLTGSALSFAARRSHRLSDRTGVSTEIDLPGRTSITDDALSGVLNRLVGPPAAAWRFAAAGERDYASAELYAFVWSWLSSLRCPVRNRPSPGCLAGPALGPLPVAAAARRAGLDCPDIRLGTETDCAAGDSELLLQESAWSCAGPCARPEQVVMCDGVAVTAEVPSGVAAACSRFAAEIGASRAVLGLDFVHERSRWILAGVTPLAALDRPVCERLLDLLAGDASRRAGGTRSDVAS